jgi:predicted phage baseplate assembly protein
MVLADHGCTIAGELLDPPEVPDIGPYRPRLQQSNLTYCVPYDHDLARQQPAAVATRQDSNAALPVISLTQVTDSSPWTAQSDLLDSDADATVFVVEMDNDRRASLRFGDGTFGRQPPGNSQFLARYRVGNGLAGNIGRETITHIVHASDDSFAAVRNLLPAHGGAEPESLAHVRSNAPYALHTQERCVIEADYAAVAARHPEVKKARAFRKWTGSWETTFLALDRRDNKPVDDDFRRTLLAFMQPYLLAGADLEIRPPLFVPLDLALTVTVAPNHFPSTVKQRLLETFSNVDLPSGQRGFFHPDNLSFGQPIYLSQIVASAAQIAGVMRVDVARFQRWSQPARGELQQGVIPIAPIEIARLDNNPNAPEYGALSLTIGTSSQGPQSP